jgi:maleylpyruvate isomerase
VFDAAARGETVERYPGGRERRAADIEAGASRPVDELVDDVRRTIWALEGMWARADAPTWRGFGLSFGEREPVIAMPFRRWREVEVHHADLGRPRCGEVAFTFEDWSDGYVRRDLMLAERAWAARRPMGLTALPPAVVALPPHRRMAWFMGRVDVPGLERPPQWF